MISEITELDTVKILQGHSFGYEVSFLDQIGDMKVPTDLTLERVWFCLYVAGQEATPIYQAECNLKPGTINVFTIALDTSITKNWTGGAYTFEFNIQLPTGGLVKNSRGTLHVGMSGMEAGV